jgi:hypothetical protein
MEAALAPYARSFGIVVFIFGPSIVVAMISNGFLADAFTSRVLRYCLNTALFLSTLALWSMYEGPMRFAKWLFGN